MKGNVFVLVSSDILTPAPPLRHIVCVCVCVFCPRGVAVKASRGQSLVRFEIVAANLQQLSYTKGNQPAAMRRVHLV